MRNLAYDQAGLASFVVLEKWTTKLMLSKLKEPPAGYRYVTNNKSAIVTERCGCSCLNSQEASCSLKLLM